MKLGIPNNEELKRDSTVREVRQWSKASKVEADIEAFNLLLDLEKLSPLEICTSTTVELTTNVYDGGNKNQDVAGISSEETGPLCDNLL